MAADLRHPWRKGRPTLRDPKSPYWPNAGEKTQDLEVAQAWLLSAYVPSFREETQRRQRSLGPSPKRLGDAAEEYLRYRRFGGVAAPGAPKSKVAHNTLQNDTVALNHLRRFAREDAVSGRRGDELRTHQLSSDLFTRLFNLLLTEEYEVNTVREYRHSLSAFLGWLGHGRENGANLCVLPERETRPEAHTWTDDQVERIREAARILDGRENRVFEHHLRAVNLALISGGRRMELFATEYRLFRPGDDEYEFTYQVHAKARKLAQLKAQSTGAALLLPVGGEWMERVSPYGQGFVLPDPDGGLVRALKAADIIAEILDLAGLHEPGIGWHSFRHTYARDFLLFGGSMEGLKESLRHATFQVTQNTYKHFRGSDAAQTSRRMMLKFQDSPVRLVV